MKNLQTIFDDYKIALDAQRNLFQQTFEWHTDHCSCSECQAITEYDNLTELQKRYLNFESLPWYQKLHLMIVSKFYNLGFSL